jgi:hypothetical protein
LLLLVLPDTATSLQKCNQYRFDGLGIDLPVMINFQFLSRMKNLKEEIRSNRGWLQSSRTVTSVTSEQDTIMAAYNIGGATVGVSLVDTSNSDYTTGKDESKTVFSLAMEF